MHGNFLRPRSARSAFVALCVGAACASASNLAMAGCGMYTGPQSAPPSWSPQSTTATDNDFEVKDSGGRDKDGRASDGSNAGIVGMWRLSFYSDGTAYPTQIPKGVMVDFGISQWHPDKPNSLSPAAARPVRAMSAWASGNNRVAPATSSSTSAFRISAATRHPRWAPLFRQSSSAPPSSSSS